jgi:hypothetical protein
MDRQPLLSEVLAAIGRDVVELQDSLDRHAKGAVVRWGDGDVPPVAWQASTVRLTLRVGAAVQPGTAGPGRSLRLLTGSPRRYPAVLSIGVQFLRPEDGRP